MSAFPTGNQKVHLTRIILETSGLACIIHEFRKFLNKHLPFDKLRIPSKVEGLKANPWTSSGRVAQDPERSRRALVADCSERQKPVVNNPG